MEPKNGCSCGPRLSYRQMLVTAWAPVAAVIIEGVLRFVR